MYTIIIKALVCLNMSSFCVCSTYCSYNPKGNLRVAAAEGAAITDVHTITLVGREYFKWNFL